MLSLRMAVVSELLYESLTNNKLVCCQQASRLEDLLVRLVYIAKQPSQPKVGYIDQFVILKV